MEGAEIINWKCRI